MCSNAAVRIFGFEEGQKSLLTFPCGLAPHSIPKGRFLETSCQKQLLASALPLLRFEILDISNPPATGISPINTVGWNSRFHVFCRHETHATFRLTASGASSHAGQAYFSGDACYAQLAE